MVNLKTGKHFADAPTMTRGGFLKGILASGIAPSITLGAIGLAGPANASVGGAARGMMRNKGAQLSCVFEAKPYDEELEYLESNERQYINTGLNFLNGFKISIKLFNIQSSNDSRLFFGSHGNSKRNFIGFNYSNESYAIGSFVLGLGGSAYKYCGTTSKAVTNSFYEIEADLLGIDQYSFSFVENGTTVSVSPVVGTVGVRDNRNCWLFACNGFSTSIYRTFARMYYCKLWDERTENPKLDFIPVLKNGVPCMYDKVGGGFYYNVISGHQFGYKKKDGTIVQPT